ncbi:hypothetical protein H8D85_02165 [bacterium]|nr:hypothetical protein [bacterium]
MPNWDESVFESGTVTEEQSSTFDNVEQQNLVDQFNNILNSAYINNLQPVFHKAIDQHLGIQISGDFKTTDATNNGDISYITVARNPNMVAAHDGYGLAWRKQPEHVLQVANAIESMINATNTADYFEINALSDDIVERFINEFNETPMQAAEYHYANSLSMKTNNKYLKYNVFLVDNDILKEGVWISPEMIWDQTGGKNQFLQAAKV